MHLLVRGLAGFSGQRKESSTWRSKRAEEMGDTNYRPEPAPQSEKDRRIADEFITDARHLDCAPPHIQQAVERLKRGEHFNIPEPA